MKDNVEIDFENINENLFDGDIRLTEEQEALIKQRKAIDSARHRWPVKAGDTFPKIDYTFNDGK